MKPVLVAALMAGLAGTAAAKEEAGSLKVVFETRDAGGWVSAALYAAPERFARTDGALRSARVRVENGRAEAVFEGLPPGTYAVGAFHDVDGNGRLNTLPVGLPTEPYGFSRDARGAFGPPRFGAAAFELRGGSAEKQVVRLK